MSKEVVHTISRESKASSKEDLDRAILEAENLMARLKAKEKELLEKDAKMNELLFNLEKRDKESRKILEEAKKNADRIVNESLLRAEKTEMETAMLRKQLEILKKRIKNSIESRLERIEKTVDEDGSKEAL